MLEKANFQSSVVVSGLKIGIMSSVKQLPAKTVQCTLEV